MSSELLNVFRVSSGILSSTSLFIYSQCSCIPPPGSMTHALGYVVVVAMHWSPGGVELSCQYEAGLWRMTIVRKLSVVQLHIKEDGRLFPVYQILQHGPNATTMTRKQTNTIRPQSPPSPFLKNIINTFVHWLGCSEIDREFKWEINDFQKPSGNIIILSIER